MDPESVEWTAFVVPNGLYEWLVMPFGLKNAPAIFQRKMDDCFRRTKNFIAVYIDDILVFSENEEQHAKHLEAMLTICEKWRLVLSPTKMKIAVQEIEFLGAVIGNRKIKLQPHIIKKIISFDEVKLKEKAGMRSWLGILNYARSYIPKLGKHYLGRCTKKQANTVTKGSRVQTMRSSERLKSCAAAPRSRATSGGILHHPRNRRMHGRMGRGMQMEESKA
ncbi:polyprotein [Rhynchospora pubera]|uniref:Polyprotein n=1 Tax=Rhynchospora pubera TaxID=906938 RepID=A0AAV8DTS2_9POAL|nr:polyprotein [Rhynchospora pubera]